MWQRAQKYAARAPQPTHAAASGCTRWHAVQHIAAGAPAALHTAAWQCTHGKARPQHGINSMRPLLKCVQDMPIAAATASKRARGAARGGAAARR